MSHCNTFQDSQIYHTPFLFLQRMINRECATSFSTLVISVVLVGGLVWLSIDLFDDYPGVALPWDKLNSDTTTKNKNKRKKNKKEKMKKKREAEKGRGKMSKIGLTVGPRENKKRAMNVKGGKEEEG